MNDIYIIDIRKLNEEKKSEHIISNMSEFRLNKYMKIKNENAKLESLAASYLLYVSLKKYGLNEKEMIYELNKYGKPSFSNCKNIHFSISHSKNTCMLVLSDKNVGCDIQVVKKIDERVFDKVLSQEEKDMINGYDNMTKYEKFFELWVIKEAKLKYIGCGITDTIVDIKTDNVKAYSVMLNDIKELYKYSVFPVLENAHIESNIII